MLGTRLQQPNVQLTCLAMLSLGSEFLSSYIRMVDGEKDPRNLMLLFAMDRVILLEFDISAHVEEMFDITFCYFPIAFRPPPNDPYGISADDLKEALRACLSATPLFAKMAIPLFIEKFATAVGPSMVSPSFLLRFAKSPKRPEVP
jgi:DNA repair/transcription protein MET18/MMS19